MLIETQENSDRRGWVTKVLSTCTYDFSDKASYRKTETLCHIKIWFLLLKTEWLYTDKRHYQRKNTIMTESNVRLEWMKN